MRLPRRKILQLAAGSAAFSAMPRIVRAETYPARPVHIIVGFPPGAASDINARLIGDWLSQRLGQQFIVDNRPGAGSNVGTEAAAHAPADGYTLLLGHAAERDQCLALRQPQFQFSPRHRPGREHHAHPHGHGGECGAADQNGRGIHRLCQGQSGQAQLRLVRQRHRLACRSRAVQVHDRRRHRPRAVSRPGAGADRSDQRPGAGDVRRAHLVDRPYPRRRSARARGDHDGALGGAAGCTDGGRYGAGLRVRAAGPASARRQTRRPTSSPR